MINLVKAFIDNGINLHCHRLKNHNVSAYSNGKMGGGGVIDIFATIFWENFDEWRMWRER
jgi:hypothetical protein